MATTTTLAAIPPPPSNDNTFFSENWWWLTIIGLALIAMIATIALLQPQRQGFGDRVVLGAGGLEAGRRAKPKPAAPTVGARVRRTKVAQTISMRGAQPKPPKPSLMRRWSNRLRDTELADTFRARSEAKQVKARSSRKKPPRLKRRR